jgi:hypothetical protein
MWDDVAQKIVLKGAVPRLVEANRNGHDFTYAQPTLPQPLAAPAGEQPLLPRRDKLLTEVVNVAEKRYDFHTRTSSVGRCWSRSPPY